MKLMKQNKKNYQNLLNKILVKLNVPEYAINSEELFYYLCLYIFESEEYHDVSFDDCIEAENIFERSLEYCNKYYSDYFKTMQERLYEYLKNILNIKVESDKTIITINTIFNEDYYNYGSSIYQNKGCCIDKKCYLKDEDYEDTIYSNVLRSKVVLATQVSFIIKKNTGIFTFEQKDREYNSGYTYFSKEGYIKCEFESKQEVYKNSKVISLTKIANEGTLPINEFNGRIENYDYSDFENIIIDGDLSKYTLKKNPASVFHVTEISMDFEFQGPVVYDESIINFNNSNIYIKEKYDDDYFESNYEDNCFNDEYFYEDLANCSVLYKFSKEKMLKKFEYLVEQEKEKRYIDVKPLVEKKLNLKFPNNRIY